MAEAASRKIKASAPTNVYSALVIIATLLLLAGTVYLAWRANDLFGNWMPWESWKP